MIDLAIASGSFFFIAVITFLQFYRESSPLSDKRDKIINEVLQNHLKKNSTFTATNLLNLLTEELGVSRLKLVLAEVEPNGFKKSMILSGIATLAAIFFTILPSPILSPFEWIPWALWVGLFLASVFFFIDDANFYYHLYKMERNLSGK